MKKLLPNASAPLYQQLYDAILEKVKAGDYKMGERIPSEPELSERYGVSRITVRNAVQQLVDDNVLVKRHGKGTYVAMPVYVESMMAEGSFTKSCLQMGKQPSTNIISISKKLVDERITKALGMKAQRNVICVERLRLVDDVPAIYELDYFFDELSFIEHEKLDNKPILDIIREHTGAIAHVFEDIIEIAYAMDTHSTFLKIPLHEPLLKVSQTVIDKSQQIIYFNEQYIRSDVYKLAIRSYK